MIRRQKDRISMETKALLYILSYPRKPTKKLRKAVYRWKEFLLTVE